MLFSLIAVATFYFLGPKDLFIRHDCELQKKGSCKATLEGVTINFTLSPLPIIPTQETTYKLEISGLRAQKVTVRLLGHDMKMEEEQVFDLLASSEDSNLYKARRIFPVCTEEIMLWRLYLIIEAKDLTLRTLYDLRVKRG